jgi:uncharacterized cupredoxin-like copper-binding protein
VKRRLAAAAALLAAAAGAAACGPADASTQHGVKTVELRAHYSHWSLSRLHVRPGQVVRFVVHNDDPIDHELIVGDQALQDRHERGTEAKHPPRPGEISVPAGSTVETMVVFANPGAATFACHLPGHYAYGMHGTITISQPGL